ncbi:hypothetical protein H5410_034029 [Solanum commersonii]|uniref:Uncharacterized protein n=1 Tax=Solanum commersonii TaxID=4109 RepID=A0A9J5YPI3_SOLCO|nr:hypothetical protein H5410_034029 [Solanum commersonii]
MRVKLGRGTVLVLLIGSRNRFADFGIGREAVVAADLQSLAGVHGKKGQFSVVNEVKMTLAGIIYWAGEESCDRTSYVTIDAVDGVPREE